MEISSAGGPRSATHASSGLEARAGSTQVVSSLQPLSLRLGHLLLLPSLGSGRETRAAGRRRGPFIHPRTGASYR